MAKEDVVFTIGADGSAFAGALKKLHDPLSKIGEAFMGLQGVTAGDSSACAGVRRYIRAQNGGNGLYLCVCGAGGLG